MEEDLSQYAGKKLKDDDTILGFTMKEIEEFIKEADEYDKIHGEHYYTLEESLRGIMGEDYKALQN